MAVLAGGPAGAAGSVVLVGVLQALCARAELLIQAMDMPNQLLILDRLQVIYIFIFIK